MKLKEGLTVFGWLTVVGVSSALITILILATLFKFSTPLLFDSTLQSGRYHAYSDIFKEDTTVLNITSLCNDSETDIEKVYCVYNYFKENFVHIDRNDSYIRTPEKMFTEGGVCRDAAVTYCAIFKNMGIECKFLIEHEKHVLSAVWIEDNFLNLCLLDQTSISCH